MSSVAPSEILANAQLITYFNAAGLSIVVFDWLLTLGDEYLFVWGTRWKLGKILFFLTRYPTFVDTGLLQYYQLSTSLSAERCSLVHTITGWLQLTGIVVAESILVIRVWALWDRVRYIGVLLIGLGTANLAVAVIFFTQFHTSQSYITLNTLAPGLPGCYRIGGNKHLYLDFLLLVFFETVLVVLTFIKGFRRLREGTSSFSGTFFRDGFVYFGILLTISLINVVVLFTQTNEFSNLLTSLQRVLHSVCSARIILNLRRKHAETRMIEIGEDDAGSTFTQFVEGEII